MYMIRLLFSFRGTIKRSEWWIGAGTIVAAMLVCTLTFTPEIFTDSSGSGTMASFMLGLVFTYPCAALTVKRFADIGWWSGFAYGAVALNMLLALLEYPGIPRSGTLDGLALAVTLLLLMSEAVVCGCLKGKDGAALHGPGLRVA